MDGLRFGLLPFVARLLLGAEFAIAVNGKISGWDGQAAYMERRRATIAPFMLASPPDIS